MLSTGNRSISKLLNLSWILLVLLTVVYVVKGQQDFQFDNDDSQVSLIFSCQNIYVHRDSSFYLLLLIFHCERKGFSLSSILFPNKNHKEIIDHSNRKSVKYCTGHRCHVQIYGQWYLHLVNTVCGTCNEVTMTIDKRSMTRDCTSISIDIDKSQLNKSSIFFKICINVRWVIQSRRNDFSLFPCHPC